MPFVFRRVMWLNIQTCRYTGPVFRLSPCHTGVCVCVCVSRSGCVHPENGENCSETCQGNNTITTYVKLTCACWARSEKCEKRLLASSCLSVRMEQLGSQWTDFDET